MKNEKIKVRLSLIKVALLIVILVLLGTLCFSQTIGWTSSQIENNLTQRRLVYKVDYSYNNEKMIGTGDDYVKMVYYFNSLDKCYDIYILPRPMYEDYVVDNFYYKLPQYYNTKYRIFDSSMDGYLLSSLEYIGKDRVVRISYSRY